MKVVIYYNEKSTLTHLSTKEVDDNYTLKPGETFELPSGFLTPAKLVNGVLTSASVEESNQVAKEYLKENGLDSDSVSAQQQIALLSTQIATQAQAQNKANALFLSEIAQLKAQIQGTTNKEA